MLFETRSGRNLQWAERREEKKRRERTLSKTLLSIGIYEEKGGLRGSVWRRLGWASR